MVVPVVWHLHACQLERLATDPAPFQIRAVEACGRTDQGLAFLLQAVRLVSTTAEDDAALGLVHTPADLQHGLAATGLATVEQHHGLGQVGVSLGARVGDELQACREVVGILGDSILLGLR